MLNFKSLICACENESCQFYKQEKPYSTNCSHCRSYLLVQNGTCKCTQCYACDIYEPFNSEPSCYTCKKEIKLTNTVVGDKMAVRSKKPVLGDQAKSLFESQDNQIFTYDPCQNRFTKEESVKEGAHPFFQAIQREPKVDIIDSAKTALVSEASDAVWRVAADQYLETAKTPVIAAFYSGVGLEGKAKSSSLAREYIGRFLESDMGEATFTYLLSFSTEFLPYQKPIAKRIARELRIKSLAVIGNKVANTFMKPMRDAMDVAIRGLNIIEG